MALDKVGEKALTVAQEEGLFKVPSRRPPKKILKEEEYTKDLEKIIVRDFFPELPKLQAQAEYLDALQKNDMVKLRELQIKYGPKRPSTTSPNLYNTPATFETPEAQLQKATPKPEEATDGTDKAGTTKEDPTHNPELIKKPVKLDSDHSLDTYLSRTTSEDNASFAEILAENQKKHEIKHAWLYEQEQEKKGDQQAALALPTIEAQAAIEGPRTQELQTWQYTAKNPLMYVPEGAAHTMKELVEIKSKPRAIIHANTRFSEHPFSQQDSKAKIQQAADKHAQNLTGKIGVDGREMKPAETPKVGGYGFVKTPSPAPGVDESPLMTWGEIEGTPFRLDGGGTPAHGTPGPTFKMQGVSRREELAMELSEQASKAHRDKKAAALKRVRAHATPTPKFGTVSRTDRLSSMSPAAQRLASSKLGIRTHTDKALRASYTPSPSPSHRLPGDKTPKIITPGRTPKSMRATPKPGSTTPSTDGTPKRNSTTELSSLTDNLLQLPKRSRAQDFF